jgi:hypothetical protein
MWLESYITKYASTEPKREYSKHLAGALGGGAAASLVTRPISLVQNSMTKKMLRRASPVAPEKPLSNAGDVKKLKKHMKIGLRTKILNSPMFDSGGSPYFVADINAGPVKVKRHIYAPKGVHPALLAHEMGHASGLGRSKVYNKITGSAGKAVGAAGTLASVFAPAGSKGEKAGIATVALSQATTLAEEARASIKGLRGMNKAGIKAKGSKMLLAKAFGTYLVQAGLTGGLIAGAYKGKRMIK